MSGKEDISSDDSKTGLAHSSKRKENGPSSYFLTEFNISSLKNIDNCQNPNGRPAYFCDEPSSSVRNVLLNVSTRGVEKKTEISLSTSYSRKKVDCATQSDRNIVGQEETFPKERKKWVRPPVVGQAANIDLPSFGGTNQTSSDSEIERKKAPKLQLSIGKSTSYFDSKSNYGNESDCIEFSKEVVATNPDNAESQRVPSPGSVSSLTSRPLEWDSGADVGYNNVFSGDPNEQRLSTIEKLALVQGTSIIFKRSDPEGTTGNNNIPIPVIKVAPPVAESTPKDLVTSKSDSDSETRRKCKKKEKNAHPLFPEVIVNEVCALSGGSSSVSPDMPRRSEFEPPKNDVQETDDLKKISVSLEEMGLDDGAEEKGDFHRSQSHNNILEESVKPQRIDSAKSRSSSSVSTVVNKRSSEKDSMFKVRHYDGVPNRDSDDNLDCLNQQHECNDHDNVSRPTSPQGTDHFNTLDSNQLTGEARVNSFEYLPGHVYENSVAKVDSDSSSQQGDGIWEDIGSHTLQEDVERGANLMAEFIRSSKASDDSALKKQLVRRVVEKLLNREYPDDGSIKSLRSSERDHNMLIESRGQISGESSTEKSHNQNSRDTPPKSNKCVGTGISTSLSGYTESSEWNTDSVAESSRKSYSDRYGPRFSGRSHEKVDKATHISCRMNRDSEVLHQTDKRDSSKLKDGAKLKRKGEEEMLMYLRKEKKNQLFWIRSEIDHLSNLKMLLEKHEALKKNLNNLRKNRQNLAKPLKSYSEHVERQKKNKTKRDLKDSKFVQGYLSNVKTAESIDSGSLHKDTGWTSHHYETEDELRIRKENIEPEISSLRRKYSKCVADPLPSSTSYTILFPKKNEINLKWKNSRADDDVLLSVGELKSAIDKIVERHRKPSLIPNIHQPPLRQCLESSRPDYIKNADGRRQILTEIVELRQQRAGSKQEIIAGAHDDIPGPPPPLAVKRVFSQKNLRKQTERKYKQLSEVRSKKAELKRKEEYRTNRLMAEVFNRKLQKRALQGQVNLSNSVCVTDPSKI